MTEANSGLSLAAGCLWGLFLGMYYFGGLWITVRFIPKVSKPRTLLFASFLVRLIVALLGIWFALRNGSLPFMATLAGFFAVRFLMTKSIGKTKDEAIHADQS